jgi:adenylate cyclase
VRRSNDQVRVTAVLVDAPSATNVWSETFDIDRCDLIRLSDEIAARLANFFNFGLIRVESARSLRERPHDPEAWDLLIRARAMFYRLARGADVSEPRRLFREALKRDDSLSEAWIGLSLTYLHNARLSPTREEDLVLADEAAERAMALDWGARSHLVRGWVRYEQKRLELAHAEFEHAIRLNPNLPLGHLMLGAVSVLLGKDEIALEPMRKAMRLSPMDPAMPYWQMMTGAACLHLQRDHEAVEWLNKSLALNPRFPFTHLFLASALALCGRGAEAQTAVAELLRLEPKFTLSRLKASELSETETFRARRKRIYEALVRAGLPE